MCDGGSAPGVPNAHARNCFVGREVTKRVRLAAAIEAALNDKVRPVEGRAVVEACTRTFGDERGSHLKGPNNAWVIVRQA